MVTRRQLRALENRLNVDDERIEFNVYLLNEDGSVEDENGEIIQPEEWQDMKEGKRVIEVK